jgi:hypothetical protein
MHDAQIQHRFPQVYHDDLQNGLIFQLPIGEGGGRARTVRRTVDLSADSSANTKRPDYENVLQVAPRRNCFPPSVLRASQMHPRHRHLSE